MTGAGRRTSAWLATVLATLTAASVPARAEQSKAPAAEPAKSAPVEKVAILDLRPAETPADRERRARSRQAFHEAVAGAPDVASIAEPGSSLASALVGAIQPAIAGERETATALLGQAATAFGQLDCAATENAVAQAIPALAGLQAVGQDVVDDLRAAYTYRLLCAHNQGDSDRAMRARARLDRLGVVQPPKGVSVLVWNLYPPLDATANARIVELEVTSQPTGAAIWVDHAQVGRTPAKLIVPVGAHVIATAVDRRHKAISIDAARDGQTVSIALPEPPPESLYLALSQRVAGWRTSARDPGGVELGALARELGVRFALVLHRRTTNTSGAGLGGNRRDVVEVAEIWRVAPGEKEAKLMGARPLEDIDGIANAVRVQANRWDRTGPDPNVELLRETRIDTTGKGQKSGNPKWWVYATVIGAIALGTTVFVASDLADDRQRIQLTWP